MTTETRKPVDLEPATCAECGHLHYDGARGYVPCPIEGCECQGQYWPKGGSDAARIGAHEAS